MNMKTFEEMKEAYLKSVGKHHIDGEHIIHSEHGFIAFTFLGDVMLLTDLWGNGKLWYEVAREIAKNNQCTRVRGGTFRNVEAFNRMFKTKIVGYIVEMEV